METEDYYQKKYITGDTRLWINLTVSVTLLGLAIYTAIVADLFKALLPMVALFIFAQRTYIAMVYYRKALLFTDRIQIQGFFQSDFTEIYYDGIAGIGFLNTEISRSGPSFLFFRRNTVSYQQDKLHISLKEGNSLALPQFEDSELNEILGFIQPRLIAGEPIHESTGVVATSAHFKGRYSQVRFESGKNGLVISIIIAVIIFLITLWSTIVGIYAFSIFFGVVCLCAAFAAWSYYTDYKEVLLYDDRMRIIDIRRKTIREIYFTDIKNVGFLHGATHTYGSDDSDGERMENMVLLMYDGSREDLTDAISNIHQLCTIIKQKVN